MADSIASTRPGPDDGAGAMVMSGLAGRLAALSANAAMSARAAGRAPIAHDAKKKRIVKKLLTIALVAAALAVTLSLAAAGSFKREPATDAAALPASELLNTLRAMGLDPIATPLRRGPYYVLHAYDPRGLELRVVADAHFGDILSIEPARALDTIFAPNYERRARIIHVLPQHRSNAPPLPGGRRTVSSAPPLADGPTPIRPTPRFDAKADRAEKRNALRDRAGAPPAAD